MALLKEEEFMNKKGKLILPVLTAVLLLCGSASSVSADTGPKPSTVIDFENMNDEEYYVTLLSATSSTGPHSAYDAENGEEPRVYGDTLEIWRAFEDYKDTDGFYFLQYYERLTGDGRFVWGYYPPDKFKILLYFPERGTYVVGQDIYEKYAFNSYYKVDGSSIDFEGGKTEYIKLDNMGRKSYAYGWELFSLAARIVITIAVELGLALLFGFRKKYWIKTILFTNIATQVLLNAGLNIYAYFNGSHFLIFVYALMEAAVLATECAVYSHMNKRQPDSDRRARAVLLYAVAANLASFGVGLLLAKVMPGIF